MKLFGIPGADNFIPPTPQHGSFEKSSLWMGKK